MTKLTINRGDSYEFTTLFKEADGTPINLTGGEVFFTVSAIDAPADDADALISVDVTSHSDPTNGETIIPLSATDTNITPGRYYYDIQFVSGSGEVVSKPRERITVKADVSRRTS